MENFTEGLSPLIRLRNNKGQSTVELALLIPILIFLIFTFIKLYDTNLSAMNKHTQTHIDRLDKFDHGNGIIFDPIYGGDVAAGQYIEFVPGSGLLDFGNVGNIAVATLATIAGNRLLDFLFSKIGFFQDSDILPEFIRGYSTSALNSYIQSGFTEVDWEGAAWDGATQSLSSQQATQMFQGTDSAARSTQEFLGSGLQGAATSFTSSHGEEQMLAQGFVNGLMTSDSFQSWKEQKVVKDADGNVIGLEDRTNGGAILMGAVGGAISSTATGVIQGEVNIVTVAQSTAMGALHTKAMAEVVTSKNYQGDPTGSMTYGAFNGGLSTLISGGNVKDAAFSAASGAFYSQQIQDNFGDSKFGKSAASLAFESGVSLAQGNSLESVGQGALASAMGYATGQASSWTQTQISEGVSNITSQGDAEDIANGITEEGIANDPGFEYNAQLQEENIENSIGQSILLDGGWGYSG
ncbi:MAG: hypothetical protein KDD46_02320 [Bdellovibrionales bacterium]|nr:hypothetical protein [Bdellovibrionales bacterium]